MQEQIQQHYRGCSIKQPDMYNILNIDIPIPPIKQQQKTIDILTPFTHTEKLTKPIDAKKAVKKGLCKFF